MPVRQPLLRTFELDDDASDASRQVDSSQAYTVRAGPSARSLNALLDDAMPALVRSRCTTMHPGATPLRQPFVPKYRAASSTRGASPASARRRRP